MISHPIKDKWEEKDAFLRFLGCGHRDLEDTEGQLFQDLPIGYRPQGNGSFLGFIDGNKKRHIKVHSKSYSSPRMAVFIQTIPRQVKAPYI